MPIDVVMPQVGESITEGTIVRWMKRVGDSVERDEPLFEISTDKIDVEIQSPAAGVVTEIRVAEGATVSVNTVVVVIAQAGEALAAMPPAAAAAAPPSPPTRADAARPTPQDDVRSRSSPLVRRIAKEHHVDISQLHGTGTNGRVTKQDILDFIESGQHAPAAPEAEALEAPAASPGQTSQVVPMTVMRRRIAERMIASQRTSAHVHSVFEVDFGRIARIRDAKKAEYEQAGAKLTFMSFIIKAAADALGAVSVVNASIDGDHVVYHQDVNIGIAVALDWGLIVPVIKRAGDRNLLEISRAVADLAHRARSRQLEPDEVAGGTFTITNPGAVGALFGMPIINQPQVAILGVGNVAKRPVVIDDAITIRPTAYLTLGYDHRLIDGAVADRFMAHIKKALETWDPTSA
jgi:2-oxoglutarate dehydrogenase E2 component (dihydrolipoamide succinyltransferase)